jgi:hypothetical protein
MCRVRLSLLLAALWGCGDTSHTPAEPTTGSLEITTVTTGDGVDPDGYVVALDGAGKPIGSNATLTLSDLAPGEHELELQGLAAECALAGPNPRPVTVEGDAPGEITLQVSCLAAVGSIALQTRTAGASPDLDGYTVALDGGAGAPIGMNALITLPRLAVGSHTLLLSGVAANCTAQGDNPRTVAVTTGSATDVTFDVACHTTSLGVLLLTINRTGEDHIFRVASDGSGLTDLTPRSEGSSGDWSPDGSRIVFASTRFLAGGIYVMAADGSNPVRLTAGGTPAWSPDGSTIAFASSDGVTVMNADGTHLRVLAPGSEPAWSPDGRRIAFTRAHCVADICGSNLYVMGADGSGARQLTTFSPFDQTGAPAWSPDGTRIAYGRRCCFLEVNASGLATIAPEGGLSSLLHRGAIVGKPVWSPDGSAIAFGQSGDAGAEAMIMPASGGAAEVLVAGPATPTSWK